MKRILTFIILFLFTSNILAAQDCDCREELDFVYDQMQGMASFKSQIKGAKKKEFNNTYKMLRSKLTANTSKAECFWQLNQLMSMVKDEHAALYEARPDYTIDDIYDSSFLDDYRKSASFTQFPSAQIDAGKLRADLQDKNANDIEGIYKIGEGSLEIGIYRTNKPDSLVGVVLNSKLGIWETGQLYAYLKEEDRMAGIYDIMMYGQVYKNLRYMNNHWVRNGMLFSNVKKHNAPRDFSRPEHTKGDAYQLKRLNDDVQYIWIDNFSRIGNVERRDALIAQIQENLTADYLVFDLRDNPGGASKISKPILKAIKKYSKAKVYVLTNYNSGSNAEQTTIRLKRMFNATHLGERTRGALAYGLNYGTSYESPSGLFKILPTDMKFNKWLDYEEVGVEPALQLANDSDWISQTLELIAEDQKS